MTLLDATLEIPALTASMFVIVPVDIVAFGGNLPDPTQDPGYTVQMTHRQSDRLGSSPTWYTASWLKDQPSLVLPARYFARSSVGSATSAPVGPGALAVGTWWPFLHITTPSENFVLRASRPYVVR